MANGCTPTLLLQSAQPSRNPLKSFSRSPQETGKMNGYLVLSFRKIAITIGLAAGLPACSNTPDRLMPMGATPLPEVLAVKGRTVRYYQTTISPASVAASSPT